ncbi:MAG: PP2C family serine/threonine-protein phosphatase [Verrucomicrobiota bacterium]
MEHDHNVSASVRLKWFGRTDRGKVRQNNEDAFLGLQFNAREVYHLGRLGEASITTMDFAFAVSDGIGGARAGECASRITMDKTTVFLPKLFKLFATGLEPGFADAFTELFDRIHRALLFVGSSYEECSGMEATLSLCWFTPGWMYFGHIGDSRIYYLPARSGGIRQLSEDDTHVGWLFRTGKLNEGEARRHPRRNVLQKALGGGNQFITPQVGAVAYEAGDIFLLCTDGVVDGLYNHHLLEYLRPTKPWGPTDDPAHRLVEAALEQSGRDNTTALVIQIL